MLELVGQVLPLALAVSISPVQIVAVILLLFSEQPRPNATAMVAGFVVGVAAVLGALVVLASWQHLGSSSTTSSGITWGQMAVGVALLGLAVRKFRRRPGPDDEPSAPAWMDGLQSFSPGRSLLAGLALGAANPKLVALGLAAAAVIASAGVPVHEQVLVVVVYTLVGTVGVAAPLVVATVMGERADPLLDRWRIWLELHNAVVMAALFAVFGVVLVVGAVPAL